MLTNANFYSQPSYMNGGTYPIYSGSRRQQKGGGLLGSISKYIAPLGRKAIHTMKRIAIPMGRKALAGVKRLSKNKTVQKLAREAARRGTEVLANVAADAIQGENVGSSLKRRAQAMAYNTLVGESLVPEKKVKKFKQTKRPTRQFITTAKAGKYRRLSRARLNRKNLF